jgi:hypothetical protein
VNVTGSDNSGTAAQTMTAADGTYSVTVTASGTATICAQKVDDGYTSSCLFDPARWDFASQRTGPITQDIQLQRTTRLEVIVDDPDDILRASQGAPLLDRQVITTANLMYPLRLTANSAKSRTYTFNVPKNTSVSSLTSAVAFGSKTEKRPLSGQPVRHCLCNC